MSFDLVDIGINLGQALFARDREEVVARAVGAGVGRMVVTGTIRNAKGCDDRTLVAMRELARRVPNRRALLRARPRHGERQDIGRAHEP